LNTEINQGLLLVAVVEYLHQFRYPCPEGDTLVVSWPEMVSVRSAKKIGRRSIMDGFFIKKLLSGGAFVTQRS
jgi:hypothetical protein